MQKMSKAENTREYCKEENGCQRGCLAFGFLAYPRIQSSGDKTHEWWIAASLYGVTPVVSCARRAWNLDVVTKHCHISQTA